ncbi:MAG: hypothetical protein ACRDT9_00130 [Agromyces sp.]
MPRDKRLYMTFPIDFHRHPKLSKLPAEVRWTFVEMNGEARIADNDGRFAAEDAEFMWPIEHLEALVRSHPARPLVAREANGGDYVIRDYAEHQQTRDERERLAEKNRQNGSKGGRPRKNPTETQSVTSGNPTEPNETQTKAESESESESRGLTLTTESSHVVDASVSTDSVLPPAVKALASAAGITRIEAIQDALWKHTKRDVRAEQAVIVARHLLSKVKGEAKAPQRYVIRAISLSPAEVQQYIDEAGLAA